MPEKVERNNHASYAPEGEGLHLVERVVVAPVQGSFRSLEDDVVGSIVTDGQTIGLIERRTDACPVISLFRGRLMDLLAHPGEYVREGEPIAWLRAS